MLLPGIQLMSLATRRYVLQYVLRVSREKPEWETGLPSWCMTGPLYTNRRGRTAEVQSFSSSARDSCASRLWIAVGSAGLLLNINTMATSSWGQ